MRVVVLSYENIKPWLVQMPYALKCAHALVPIFEDIYLLMEVFRISNIQWSIELTMKFKASPTSWVVVGQLHQIQTAYNDTPWDSWTSMLIQNHPDGWSVHDVLLLIDNKWDNQSFDIPGEQEN